MSTLKNLSIVVFLIGGIFSVNTNAQIIYTDINPDRTSSDTYNLDLNNDGTIDFVITHTTKSVKSANGSGCLNQTGIDQYIKITPSNNSRIVDQPGTNNTKKNES